MRASGRSEHGRSEQSGLTVLSQIATAPSTHLPLADGPGNPILPVRRSQRVEDRYRSASSKEHTRREAGPQSHGALVVSRVAEGDDLCSGIATAGSMTDLSTDRELRRFCGHGGGLEAGSWRSRSSSSWPPC
jgi:hypothetical protein